MQDEYLEKLKQANVSVSIYLINGIKLSGLIEKYDSQAILLADAKNMVNQLIYKHAISTIVPSKNTNVQN